MLELVACGLRVAVETEPARGASAGLGAPNGDGASAGLPNGLSRDEDGRDAAFISWSLVVDEASLTPK